MLIISFCTFPVHSADDSEQSNCTGFRSFRCDDMICIRRCVRAHNYGNSHDRLLQSKIGERCPDANSISGVLNSNQGSKKMPLQYLES